MKIRVAFGDKNMIGKQLAAIRKAQGLKQHELIAKLQASGYDIHPNSYSKIEGQNREVTDIELYRIAKELGVSVDMLFPKDVQNPANQS